MKYTLKDVDFARPARGMSRRDKMAIATENLEKLKLVSEDESFDGTVEQVHVMADQILVDFINSVGGYDIVKAYGNINKWR